MHRAADSHGGLRLRARICLLGLAHDPNRLEIPYTLAPSAPESFPVQARYTLLTCLCIQLRRFRPTSPMCLVAALAAYGCAFGRAASPVPCMQQQLHSAQFVEDPCQPLSPRRRVAEPAPACTSEEQRACVGGLACCRVTQHSSCCLHLISHSYLILRAHLLDTFYLFAVVEACWLALLCDMILTTQHMQHISVCEQLLSSC